MGFFKCEFIIIIKFFSQSCERVHGVHALHNTPRTSIKLQHALKSPVPSTVCHCSGQAPVPLLRGSGLCEISICLVPFSMSANANGVFHFRPPQHMPFGGHFLPPPPQAFAVADLAQRSGFRKLCPNSPHAQDGLATTSTVD